MTFTKQDPRDEPSEVPDLARALADSFRRTRIDASHKPHKTQARAGSAENEGRRMTEEHPHAFSLGDKVLVTGGINRETVDRLYRSDICRAWVPYERPEIEAVVVGKRTLSNGHIEVHTEDVGLWGSAKISTWIPEDHFTAYLVVTDIRTKPIYVLPEQIRSAS